MLNRVDLRAEISRFLRHAIVGGVGTITDVGLLNLLHQAAGWPLWRANALSFCVALLQAFWLHRRWTYPEMADQDARVQLVKFAIISVIGLGLSQIILLGVHALLHRYWIMWLDGTPEAYAISVNFAKAASIAVVLCWNYSANRLWTFRRAAPVSHERPG